MFFVVSSLIKKQALDARFRLVPWSVFFWKLPPNLDTILVTRIFDCKTSMYFANELSEIRKRMLLTSPELEAVGRRSLLFSKNLVL